MKVKKEGMHQYVYWYNPGREMEENEIMKPIKPYKYVINNIDKLEEWSGQKFDTVLYDSERDGEDASIIKEIFFQKIKHR